ncbi:TOBE domain-containing protein [Muriicola sp. Z0-33]|uniref:TOBE domain-containing protein n=1 Tax=Muriicola sp. Z0-33 TaxID=2816957 RepID=UPI00223843C1|nr:TOBE domain-containing protein [Muriicola sp. Z0-33]MCW5515987.1 TOBE domain-containing protein [Muriicola sp. Z0-33]
MNSLKGHIAEITVNGSMSLVTLTLGEAITLKSIVIDTPQTAPYLQEGVELNLLFKETEVVIANDDIPGISMQNQIPATISNIEMGVLLSRLVLQSAAGIIVAVAAAEAIRKMQLKEGDKVIALIKLNEIILSEC